MRNSAGMLGGDGGESVGCPTCIARGARSASLPMCPREAVGTPASVIVSDCRCAARYVAERRCCARLGCAGALIARCDGSEGGAVITATCATMPVSSELMTAVSVGACAMATSVIKCDITVSIVARIVARVRGGVARVRGGVLSARADPRSTWIGGTEPNVAKSNAELDAVGASKRLAASCVRSGASVCGRGETLAKRGGEALSAEELPKSTC